MEKILMIVVPGNLDRENAFDPALQEHTVSSKLRKVKTADLGSLYEPVYTVTSPFSDLVFGLNLQTPVN